MTSSATFSHPRSSDGTPVWPHEPLNGHQKTLVAVNAPSTTAQGADEIIASEFFSDGDLIQGWYWLRDAAHGQTADWTFTSLPPGTADIELRFEVLATDRASGLPGIDANFYLSYGVPPSGQMGGVLFERLRITLENQPVPRDLTGYFCLCLLYTSPSPRDRTRSRMPSSA